MYTRGRNGTLPSIHAAALLIGAAGLLSRLLGIARDRLLAAHFGASRALDIYYAAFQIPDFFFTVFLLGAASAAIIPVLVEMKEKNISDAKDFVYELGGLFIAGACAIAAIMIGLIPFVIPYAAPGFSSGDRALVITLTRIMMVSPVLLGISNIISAVVQTHRRFLTFALSSVCYNLGIIFGILVFLPRWGISGLAAGVVLGALLHMLVQIPTLFSLGFGFPFSLGWIARGRISRAVKKVIALSLPRVVAISASNLTSIALVAIASLLGSGSISVFAFATNLRFVPIGIFGVSVAIAALPALSLYSARKDAAAFYETFFGAARTILFWVLPAASLSYVLRAQIVRVALGAGHFSWNDTRLTAALLGILTIAIIAESLSALLIRSFYTLGNTKKPLVINIATACVSIILAMAFARLFQNPGNAAVAFFSDILLHLEGVRGVAVIGIALGASLGSALDMMLLWWSLSRELAHILPAGEYNAPIYARDIMMMGIAAGIAGFIAYGTLHVVTLFVTLDRFSSVLLQGGSASAAGLAAYWGLLYFLKNREIFELIDAARRHMFRLRILPAYWGDETQ